jgi:hypothetical protein
MSPGGLLSTGTGDSVGTGDSGGFAECVGAGDDAAGELVPGADVAPVVAPSPDVVAPVGPEVAAPPAGFVVGPAPPEFEHPTRPIASTTATIPIRRTRFLPSVVRILGTAAPMRGG